MDVLSGKTVFLTGGSGFVGTCLSSKLLFDSSIEKLYILVRGGHNKLLNKWCESLPAPLVRKALDTGKLVALDGDITKPSLGLDESTVQKLHDEVSVVIHSASSINLGSGFAKIAPAVLDATLEVADIACGCKNLEKFVFVSTAYCNAHLHKLHDGIDTVVEEKLYPLSHPRPELKAFPSLNNHLSDRLGDFDQRHLEKFPWAYAYAKNLTEKVLVEKFAALDGEQITLEADILPSKLLIVRPSIIGPAIHFPFPGFEVAGSVPSTTMTAAVNLCFNRQVTCSSRFAYPNTQSNLNEVPVDLVVNSLIMHLHFGTKTIVHATADSAGRTSIEDIWKESNCWRTMPRAKLVWKDVDWKSKELSPIPRLWVILGTSYDFCTDANARVQGLMDDTLLRKFPLGCGRKEVKEMYAIARKTRKAHIEAQMKFLMKRFNVPPVLAPVLIRKTPRSVKVQ